LETTNEPITAEMAYTNTTIRLLEQTTREVNCDVNAFDAPELAGSADRNDTGEAIVDDTTDDGDTAAV